MADDRVFADGTPADVEPFPLDSVPVEEWRQALDIVRSKRRTKMPANPPASQTHKMEQGAPWRRSFEDEIDEENRIAEEELQRKRINGLAIQTCKGLAKNYGINYDPTEFGNILAQAYQVRARSAAQAKAAAAAADAAGATAGAAGAGAGGGAGAGAGANDEDGDEELRESEEDVKALSVLEAVLKFDLPRVISLLSLKPVDVRDGVLATRTLVLSGKGGGLGL